jgi:hypothetical protein
VLIQTEVNVKALWMSFCSSDFGISINCDDLVLNSVPSSTFDDIRQETNLSTKDQEEI